MSVSGGGRGLRGVRERLRTFPPLQALSAFRPPSTTRRALSSGVQALRSRTKRTQNLYKMTCLSPSEWVQLAWERSGHSECHALVEAPGRPANACVPSAPPLRPASQTRAPSDTPAANSFVSCSLHFAWQWRCFRLILSASSTAQPVGLRFCASARATADKLAVEFAR